MFRKIGITNSEASAVYGNKFTDKMLYDGITSISNGGYILHPQMEDGQLVVFHNG